MSKELEQPNKKEKKTKEAREKETDKEVETQEKSEVKGAAEVEKVSEEEEDVIKSGDSEQSGEGAESEKAVVIEAEAYKTIILYASRYANQSIPKENWKEIYGVLIGHMDEDIVYVERAEALTYGHATDVQLNDKHLAFIAEIEDELYREAKHQFIVGWFHSHPGLGLFYSYVDLINHIGFQGKNPDAIGLVFDHTLLGKKKLEKVEGTDHKITKYDTGFEIYRMNDVNMDINVPEFDENYHEVDYIVKGLNKFFFANVLSELSSLVSAGKPLQAAYRENISLESNYSGEQNIGKENETLQQNEFSSQSQEVKDESVSTEFNDFQLENIPMDDDIAFNGDELFYGAKRNQIPQTPNKEEEAEQLIYEGNQAFQNDDVFQGVEKYRRAIKKFEDLKRYDRILETLKNVAEECISSDHVILADEFAEKLLKIAEQHNKLFYKGEGYYLMGYLFLKQGKLEKIRDALNKIQVAAVIFNDIHDYVGAALCFHKIGSIYHSRLNNLELSVIFYREALENYNNAIVKSHPLRKTLWSRKEILIQKVLDIEANIEELLPKVMNIEIKKKIREELNSINYNF